MTHELHPGLDELILYCMGTPDAAEGEGEGVRSHVENCVDCRAEVAQLHADLAFTAMTVPKIAPPTAAKTRLFQAAGVEIPSIKKVTEFPNSDASRGNGAPVKAERTGAGLLWAGWLAAAACLLYAVQIHRANQGMQQQLSMETTQVQQSTIAAARAQEILDLLSSPHAQRVTLIAAHAKPEPAGQAVYLADRGALVFTASNLEPLPANKTYELWVIPASGAAPVPAGTFTPDARGMASILLPQLPTGISAKAFGVTLEDTGGSTTPTLPILLAGG